MSESFKRKMENNKGENLEPFRKAATLAKTVNLFKLKNSSMANTVVRKKNKKEKNVFFSLAI